AIVLLESGQLLFERAELVLAFPDRGPEVAAVGRDVARAVELLDTAEGVPHPLQVWHEVEARGGREPVRSGLGEVPGIEHDLPHPQPTETGLADVQRRRLVLPVPPPDVVA